MTPPAFDTKKTDAGYRPQVPAFAIGSGGCPHGLARAEAWLRASDVVTRGTGWSLVGALRCF